MGDGPSIREATATSGSGGVGGLPSSRLTRILQEKAELLKRQRQAADQATRRVEERIAQLEALSIELPEVKDRWAAIQALARKADWESVEAQAKALLELTTKSGQAPFTARRDDIVQRVERVAREGVALPAEYADTLQAATNPPAGEEWPACLPALAKLDALARTSENEFSASIRARGRALAEWAGAPAEEQVALDGRLRVALEGVREGRVAESLGKVQETLVHDLPAAGTRRESARTVGKALRSAAQELGVPYEGLEAALAADAEAGALDWPTTVAAIEAASAQVAETVRDKVVAAIESLRSTLESIRLFGVDPSEALVRLGEAMGAVPTASPSEIPKLLQEARAATEEPVVGIVASLLDEVRPRLVEARRMGRDASEVFAAMNRAREALRLKIYSEALAASQEAIDRVGALVGDLDTAREETESLSELLGRLKAARFDTAPFEARLERVREELRRVELEPARQLLQETIQTLGSQAGTAFTERLEALERAFPIAVERGFLPNGAEEDLAKVRRNLEDGRLADAGELLGAVEVRLRTGAGPYVSRRVQEMERGFEDIPDEALVGPVRRLLADADVELRVKEDLTASLESLRRAEREFTAVFAAHASALVELLEEERRTLEAMGGAGDEIQRQIDEVQQIFNMGDFVKASRASQEIRSRAHQQQLVRSEESVSHAKLALVELGKMGVDAAALRGNLDRAGEAARAHKYADAFKLARETEEAAGRLRAKAQSILDELQEANGRIAELAKAGVAVDPFREKVRLAQAGYQALDLDGAKDGLDVLMALLKAEQSNTEARRLLAEADLLREDAQRLSLPAEGYVPRIAEAQATIAEGRSAEGLLRARGLQTELIELVKPVLAEHVRTVERDLEVARAANLDIAPITELLGEARRRLGLPVPTGVAELLESARSRLVETRGFHEHAERALKRARDALNEAELVHAPTVGARERLAALEASVQKREYAPLIDAATAFEREMLQTTYQQVSKNLAGFQGAIVRARQSSTDTSVAENLLQQARQALEEGRPLEALQIAGRSEAELERVELQVRIAQGCLATVEAKLAQAEHEGVQAKVATEKLAEARAAFGDHLYPVVLELAIDATDSLGVARENFRRSREALDSADRQVKEGLELGADVAEVVGTLESARSAHQAGDYTESVHRARDTAERARWAVERLYARTLTDLRHLLETVQSAGLAEPKVPLERTIGEVENALKLREWKRATELMAEARNGAAEALAARYDTRRAELEALYAGDSTPASAAESAIRTEALQRSEEAKTRGVFAEALETLRVEEARVRELRKAELQGRLAGLKERLWVGEKLGLDTTPVMELFSEAQIELQAGRLTTVPKLLHDGEERLRGLIGPRLDERLKDTQTELVFAQEGLHVALTDVAARLAQVPAQLKAGQTVEAARTVLEAADELNRRKALHRELMNLHYLIDAALGRAAERRVDTAEARKLLDESIRARATDYPLALEKARAALKILQTALQGTDPTPPAGFWPFKRPPTGASGGA